MGSAGAFRRLREDAPHAVGQSEGSDVFGQVVESAEDRPWILQRPQAGLGQACRHTQPGLLADLNQHAIFHPMQLHRKGGGAAGSRAGPSGDLHHHLVSPTDLLRADRAAVELAYEGLGHAVWRNRPVIGSLIKRRDSHDASRVTELSGV